MEASQSVARALDAYVRHGTSDPQLAVARLGFWAWRTREIVDFVEWLPAHSSTSVAAVTGCALHLLRTSTP
jgi:erythromycin esterase